MLELVGCMIFRIIYLDEQLCPMCIQYFVAQQRWVDSRGSYGEYWKHHFDMRAVYLGIRIILWYSCHMSIVYLVDSNCRSRRMEESSPVFFEKQCYFRI